MKVGGEFHSTNLGACPGLWWRKVRSRHLQVCFVSYISGATRDAGYSFTWYIWTINILKPRQNGRHFADDIFNCIFLNENIWISPKISLKFVPEVPMNNIQALVQIMAWRRSGDKPLSELKLVRLPTHICVARSQWVYECKAIQFYFCFAKQTNECETLH